MVTEADGVYLFPALPAGPYALTFELSSFQTLKRDGIVLASGQTLTVNAQLEVATLEQHLTVTGSPVVDVQSTKIGTELSGRQLASVPSATDVWSTLAQSPGIRMRSYDVGSSHKSQTGGYEGFGVRGQNRALTEGIDQTEGEGGACCYDDYFATDEVSVTAAGGDVEMANGGVVTLITIKSGGDQFSGLFNLTYEGENFVGDNIDEQTQARGFTGNKNLVFWEGHADVGGPIKRQKLWFFAAYNHFKIDKLVSGVPRSVATDLGIFDAYTLKTTYKMSAKDTVVGYFNYGRKLKPNRGLSASTPAESVLAQDTPWWQIKGEHQRVWTNRLFSTVRWAHAGFQWPMVPQVDARTTPPRLDTGTGVNSGAGWGAFTLYRHWPQAYAMMSYYLPATFGSHELKGGFQYRDDRVQSGINGNSGPVRYLDLNGRVDRVELVDVNTFDSFTNDWGPGDDINTTYSAFLQDRWIPTSQWTITLGLRYERQRSHYEEGIRAPLLTEVFSDMTIPSATLSTRNSLSPRLGVAYDPFGRGQTVIKGFYGRYYDNYADAFAGANPGGVNTKTYTFLDPNGNRIYDGPQELGELRSTSGGATTRFDPSMKRPHINEFNFSLEHQFWGESSLRVAHVRKMVRDRFGTVNLARVGQLTVPATVSVNIRQFGDPNVTSQTFDIATIPASLTGVFDNVITSLPDGNYTYDTLQFAFRKRLFGNVFFNTSFDYQWRNELRNTSSSTSPLTSDPFGIGYFENVRPDVPNRQKSSNWQARFLGRYELPGAVGFAANLRVQSGYNYTRTVAASVPNMGTVVFLHDDVRNHRSNSVSILDFRIDKVFEVNQYRLRLIGDVFNVANSNAVTNFFVTNGSNYNRIISTLDPRTAQVAIRFEF